MGDLLLFSELNVLIFQNGFHEFCRQFKAHQLMAVRLGSSSAGLPPNPAPWNYLWRNEPVIPVTPEEKAKAARKYGMIPEDYEPIGTTDPDMGKFVNYGDYPKMAFEAQNEMPTHYPYDMPELKRDYGWPLHVDDWWLDERKYDSYENEPKIYSPYRLAAGFFLVMPILFYLLTKTPRAYYPALRQGRPNDGKTHYYFEKVDS